MTRLDILRGGRRPRLLAAAAVLAAGAAALPAAATASTPLTRPPLPGQIFSVAAHSDHNAWMVGDQPDSQGAEAALAEHWNGSRWKQAPVAEPVGAQNFSLTGATMIGTRNVWAAGKFKDSNGVYEPLIEHKAKGPWTVSTAAVPSGSPQSLLSGIDGVSKTDVWAVGAYLTSRYASVGLVEHWDGSSWTQVAIADPGGSQTVLQSVSALSADDVWVAGSYADSSGNTDSLIEHWDGSAWTQVSTPSPSSYTLLGSVSADSATDAWAVGSFADDTGSTQALLLHWEGTAWSQVDGAAVDGSNQLQSVVATSADDVWAAGYVDGPLVEHWDGSSWTRVQAPNPHASIGTYLYAAGATSSGDAWVAGFYETVTYGEAAIAEHWNGTTWKRSRLR